MFWRRKRQAPPSEPEGVHRCSFCNKSQRYVRKLIAGPNVNICDECVDICLDIVQADKPGESIPDGLIEPEGKAWPVNGPILLCALCRMPSPVDHALFVDARGTLCLGCVGAIEAAAAERRVDTTA